MKITPIDISGHRFAKRMRGYDQEEVRSFLNLVSAEFEKIVIENNAQPAQAVANLLTYDVRILTNSGRKDNGVKPLQRGNQ